MSEHTLVVEVDTTYAKEFPNEPVEHTWHVECSDPKACPGWIECDLRDDLDHSDQDWDGEDEEKIIHGMVHQHRYGYGWVLDFEPCPLVLADLELPDGMDDEHLVPGRYPVDQDWDDHDAYIMLINPEA